MPTSIGIIIGDSQMPLWGLVREWGRIGSSGRMRTDWIGSECDAKDARFTLHTNKAKRGYD